MTLDIEPADADDWNAIVDRSDGTSALHGAEALSVIEDHAGAEVTRLVGYNGNEPIGVFPVFESQAGPFTLVTSPPKLLHTFQLGPAMVGTDRMKRRKQEQYRREFVTECLDWVDEHIDPDSTFVRTTPEFGDIRPFGWNGFEATPYYTYAVDLTTDREELIQEFSSDARSNIRNADEDEYTVEVGGKEALRRTFRAVANRHAEIDAPFKIDQSFVVDLYERTPEGVVRPYVCRVDGEFATGMITLCTDSTVYRWQGGGKSDTGLQATDLLDWHIICDSMDRGHERYDLVGANIPRICDYKSKFAPDVQTYYTLDRNSRLFSASAAVKSAISR